MFAGRFLGAVLVLASSATVSTALEPAPDTLRYVIGFFRHGVRSPMMSSAIPNDPNKERYLELERGGVACLTKIGKQAMFVVGRSLRERYGSFINGYQDDKVKVTSTLSSRTVMSAITVMAAMFPPTPGIFRNLPWQPIPVWNRPQPMEKAYIYINEEQTECPRYADMSSEATLKFSSVDDRKENQLLYKTVQQYTGEQHINTPSQLYDIFDTLYFAQRNGFQLPSWSTTPLKELNNKPIFPDLLLPFKVQFFESIMYYNRNEDMLNVFSGPLLHAITSKFLQISADPSSPERFWYHSTHDTTIYPLLRGLKVDEPLTAEPGDGVLVELHVEKKEKYVKIYMYNALSNTLTELQSRLCPAPCTLAKFSVNLKGLTPKQWKQLCNKQ